MQTKIITTSEEFYNLKDDWERLQKQDPDVTYYSTFEYLRTWWDVYKEEGNKKLFIICIYNGRNIIGIAPLMIECKMKMKLSYNILKFLGCADYFTFVLDKTKGLELTIIKTIFKEIVTSNTHERLQLTHINHKTSLANFLLRNDEYNKEFKYLVECPIMYFNRYNSFDEYKKIYNIDKETKYYINKLQKEVGYKFKIIKSNEAEIYERISQLHIEEQEYLVKIKNRNDRSSLFSNNLYSKFIKNIYKDNENVITFVIEDDNSNLISYYTCYYYKNILHFWNTGYNPKYEKYSVSRITNYETFKYIFENKLPIIFEFGAGRYPWKFKWTKDFIFDYQLDMWNSNTRKGRNFKWLYCLKQKMKK